MTCFADPVTRAFFAAAALLLLAGCCPERESLADRLERECKAVAAKSTDPILQNQEMFDGWVSGCVTERARRAP